jgi:hypothetical protein
MARIRSQSQPPVVVRSRPPHPMQQCAAMQQHAVRAPLCRERTQARARCSTMQLRAGRPQPEHPRDARASRLGPRAQAGARAWSRLLSAPLPLASPPAASSCILSSSFWRRHRDGARPAPRCANAHAGEPRRRKPRLAEVANHGDAAVHWAPKLVRLGATRAGPTLVQPGRAQR